MSKGVSVRIGECVRGCVRTFVSACKRVCPLKEVYETLSQEHVRDGRC